MSNVNAEIKWQGNDNQWFTANASTVYPANIQIFHIDGRYKFTDGVTTLSALPFLGGNSYILTDAEIGSVINSAASATPNDTDLVMSVDTSVAKKNTWTQIKAFLKTYFDTVYATITDLTGYVKKGTLTTNYIPKVTASDTIGDSQIFDNGNNVGIGTTYVSSKLHVKGIDSTSSNYALKVDDSSSNPLLYVRNDGRVAVGTSTPTSKLTVATQTTYDGIWLTNNTGSPLAIIGKNISGGLQTGFLDIRNSNGDIKVCFSLNEFSLSDFINTGLNFGIGNFTTVISPTAKLHVQGIDSTSGNYALKVDDSSSNPLLYVRNDGAALFYGGVNLDNLTPSQRVETDANKNLISVPKGTADNKNFGNTAGTVLEGNKIFDLRQIYKSIRKTQDSATITGTTSETILDSILIPANTFSAGDVIYLEHRSRRSGSTGSSTLRFRINTSITLSFSTILAKYTANSLIMPALFRNLVIKTPTNTELANPATSLSTDIGGITAAASKVNIDWTIDQYILVTVTPSVVGESNISSYFLIERR